MENIQIQIPEGWENVELGNSSYFKILGSGINLFDATKDYLSTSSIEEDKVVAIEQEITYKHRPSRANMQPLVNSVWFAKMKNTLKVFNPSNRQIENSILSTGFCGVFSNNVSSDYLFQIFLSNEFNNQKDLLAIGSTQEAINNTKVKQIQFLLPKSLTEQKKIAEILSIVDKSIEQTQSLIAKYQRIKTGLMQDLLTKGIDENGNIRSEETHEFKDSELGRIPVEWNVEKLEKLSFKIGDGTHASVKFSENESIPFLFVSCIKPNKIEWSKCTYIDYDVYKTISKGKTPNKGTVLYTIVGSYGNAVVLENNRKLSFQRHIGFIETKKDILIPEFLTHFFNSFLGKKQADDLAVGNAQKTITLGALKEFQISVPQKNEQIKIINKIKFLENQNIIYLSSNSKLKSLKTGLMQDLLSGKKRVTNLIGKEAL